jgi:hypothetical protein
MYCKKKIDFIDFPFTKTTIDGITVFVYNFYERKIHSFNCMGMTVKTLVVLLYQENRKGNLLKIFFPSVMLGSSLSEHYNIMNI